MKSKLFWSFCTVLVASLPVPGLAQTSPPTSPQVDFDYKGGSMKYQLLPGRIQDRTLPRAFDFPIITNVGTDTSITSDFLITDQFRAPAGSYRIHRSSHRLGSINQRMSRQTASLDSSQH
ncbi:hypothetical protein [Microcoleus vaginatus]|uniref:hypothetical protein n=1 Tax=Microcoleus vaginatus TaxID=119532 RepID=UPI00403F6861